MSAQSRCGSISWPGPGGWFTLSTHTSPAFASPPLAACATVGPSSTATAVANTLSGTARSFVGPGRPLRVVIMQPPTRRVRRPHNASLLTRTETAAADARWSRASSVVILTQGDPVSEPKVNDEGRVRLGDGLTVICAAAAPEVSDLHRCRSGQVIEHRGYLATKGCDSSRACSARPRTSCRAHGTDAAGAGAARHRRARQPPAL